MAFDDKVDNKAEEVGGKVKEGVGKATDNEDLEAESLWDRVDARPIELVFSDDDIVLTMRAVIDDEAVFIGNDGDLIVFVEPEDLATYCREAEEHELVTLIEGEGAKVADTRGISEWLSEDYPDIALEVHHGGQPLYPYYFGLE